MSAKITFKNNNSLAVLLEKARSLPVVKVGVPKAAGKYEEGVPIAVVAAVHEFGSLARNIPARPFLNPGLENTVKKLPRLFKAFMPKVLDGAMSVENFAEFIGELAVSEVTAIWNNNNWKARKDDLPHDILLQTGKLKRSIVYELVRHTNDN